MTQALRERMFGLLSELCPDLPNDTLRVTSHALLTLAVDTDTDALMQVRDALPWMGAYIELEGGASGEFIARELRARGALRCLTDAYVARRLVCTQTPSAQSVVLRDLAALDLKLARISASSDREIRSELLDDVELLTACLEVMDGEPNSLMRIRGALGVRIADPGALRVLTGLETSWNGGTVREANLSERSRRFELSAVDHLRQQGFLVAIRAALGLSSCEIETLHSFAVFREDPPLEQLTNALIALRGVTLRHVRGMVPLSALNPWIEYLRGPCSDLAESRGITLREATSFAHFCFHVMNFCDLVAVCGNATHDDIRRTLMDVEDEVKEFALMGQSAGHSDQRASLGVFDAVRWKRLGSAVFAADRIGRLAGAWKRGTEPTPMGAPARIGGDVADEARQAVLDGDSVCPGSAHLVGTGLAHARIVGGDWMERVPPTAIFAGLAVMCVCAREAGVDTSHAFNVDVSDLASWTETPQRSAVFEQWLSRAALQQAMGTGQSQVAISGGSSTHQSQGSIRPSGLIATLVGDGVRIEFRPSPELEAALTLLSSGVDTTHEAMLAALIQSLIGSGPSPHATVSLSVM